MAVSDRPMALADLQQTTGLPRATTHRLATALEAMIVEKYAAVEGVLDERADPVGVALGVGDGLAEDSALAGRRGDQAHEGPDQGGLPRPVRTHQADDRAPRHIEIEAVEGEVFKVTDDGTTPVTTRQWRVLSPVRIPPCSLPLRAAPAFGPARASRPTLGDASQRTAEGPSGAWVTRCRWGMVG